MSTIYVLVQIKHEVVSFRLFYVTISTAEISFVSLLMVFHYEDQFSFKKYWMLSFESFENLSL